MAGSRIKNPELAALLEGELHWLRYVSPITEYYCRQIEQRDYRGKRLAYWGHIAAQNIIPMLALREAGAEIVMGACNADPGLQLYPAHLEREIAERSIEIHGTR